MKLLLVVKHIRMKKKILVARDTGTHTEYHRRAVYMYACMVLLNKSFQLLFFSSYIKNDENDDADYDLGFVIGSDYDDDDKEEKFNTVRRGDSGHVGGIGTEFHSLEGCSLKLGVLKGTGKARNSSWNYTFISIHLG